MTKTISKIQPQSIKLDNKSYILLPLEVWQEYEDFVWQSSAKLQKELAEAREEIKQGKGVSYLKLRKELGLK